MIYKLIYVRTTLHEHLLNVSYVTVYGNFCSMQQTRYKHCFHLFSNQLNQNRGHFNTVKCTINAHSDCEGETAVSLCFSCFIGSLNDFRLLKVIQADNFTRCETFAKILSRKEDFVKKNGHVFF